MTIPAEKLELAVFLYTVLEQRKIVNLTTVQGILPLNIDFSGVELALEKFDICGICDIDSRAIEFFLPVGDENYFALSLSDYLSNTRNRTSARKRFYIAEYKYICSTDNATAKHPEEIRNYLQAIELYSALLSLADHVYEANSAKIVYLNKRKLEINANFSVNDLCELKGLNEFIGDFVSNTLHSTQKKSIIKSELEELFSQDHTVINLSSILKIFPTFYEKVKNSYALYLSEFSFEKIQEKVEKEKVEFISGLNKVFSDIQNQLLGIPVALILAGGQMENKSEWIAKNNWIWLGCIIFAFFMSLLIRNQRTTLEAINVEMQRQWKKIKVEHKSVSSQFKTTYRDLSDRYNSQKRTLIIVDLIVAVVVSLVTGLLFWYSASSVELKRLFNYFPYILGTMVPLFLLINGIAYFRKKRGIDN